MSVQLWEMIDILRKIMLHIAVFSAVVLILWGLLIASSCIPNSAIKKNMLESSLSYSQKDAFYFDDNGRYNSVADNYADSILLNVMWNIKSDSPVISSLDTKYYDGEEYGENWGLYQAINGTAANTDYSRYWHGSVIFIRPLMLFTDVDGIKIIGFIALLLLITATIIMLVKGKHYFAVVALIISLVGIQFWNVRLSLEYIPAFMVCFALCPLYIHFEKRGDFALTLISVAGGTMISFFDFLTVETITLLVPLALIFIIRADEKKPGSFKENLILMIKCGICWGISYMMTYIIKWTAASIATGENKFGTAFSAAGIRLYGDTNEASLPLYKQIFSAVAANLSTLFGGTERIDTNNIIIGLVAVTFVIIVLLFLFRKKKQENTITLTLIAITAIPYIRYMVLNNHSYLHEFFTYRAQIIVIICICAVVWYNIDLGRIRKGRKEN